MDPFKAVEKKSTAPQWVNPGMFTYPGKTGDWELENAVLNGYSASGWVFACANILAGYVSLPPWKVWAPDNNGDDQVVPNHPIGRLIENPNDHWTRQDQMHFRALHIILGGNSLDKIIYVDNEPKELWNMRPDGITPIPDRRNWLRGYRVKSKGGQELPPLEPEVVIHAKRPDPRDPYWGISSLRAVANVIDMDVQQVRWNRNLVDNDTVPSGVFSDPNIRTQEDRKRVKEAMKRAFSGPVGAREPMVLSNGAQWLQMGISPRELDWVESRSFTVGEICAAMGFLPARFINDAATYNNLKHAIKYEWDNGAMPIIGFIANAMTLRLGVKIFPDLSGIAALREDIHKSADSFAKFVSATVPPQTAAGLLGLPVGELPVGDRTFHQVNLQEFQGEDDEDEMTETSL